MSYSHKDSAFVERLDAALGGRGFETFIDREEIFAFEPWWERIQKLIGRADTVIFVLSPDSVSSDIALKELAYAASLNKRLAPIVWRAVKDGAVPDVLRQLNFIFFDEQEAFGASVGRLADALQTDIGWLRQHTEYGEAERRWSEAGKPNGLLLHSPTLDIAVHWLGSHPPNAPEATTEVRTFIAASRQAQRRVQRRQRLARLSIFTLLVGVILGLLGWINQLYIADQWRWWTVRRPYAAAHVWPHLLSAAEEQALKPGQSFKECARDCPQMVVVPAGSFMMGAWQTDRNAYIELPHHWVTIAKPFAVSKYEVTFADWDACVAGGGCDGHEPNPQGWGRGRQPLIDVNWDDVQRYLVWLSQVTGKTYRLPSEAEYEYATRAGTTTVYPWGDDIKLNGQAMANCNGCGSQWDHKQAAPVGSFPPNKFGLYDMVGNVNEFTEDCLHLNYDGAPTNGAAWLAENGGNCNSRVVRAGSWIELPVTLRSTYRAGSDSVNRYDFHGFRVARTLTP